MVMVSVRVRVSAQIRRPELGISAGIGRYRWEKNLFLILITEMGSIGFNYPRYTSPPSAHVRLYRPPPVKSVTLGDDLNVRITSGK